MSSSGTTVYTDFEAIPPASRAITIGNFDGVHRGHQYLIQRVVEEAHRRQCRALVVTFEPHPTSVLRPDVPFVRLATADEKLRLLTSSGVDEVLVLPFTVEFSRQEPEEFLERLTKHASPTAIFVGEGFRFGRDRSGDGETIARFGREHGFEATVIQRLREGEAVISSSSIRNALTRGDIAAANAWLGRRYRLRGEVEHGAARGQKLGYPTANLQLDPIACLPADGIYAAYAHIVGSTEEPLPAVVYVGSRPTFDNGRRIVEAHILDFVGDLYARELEIEFVEFIRADVKFDTAEALAAQMERDERDARQALSLPAPPSSS